MNSEPEQLASGWSAECQDCPTTLGGYGECVHVGTETPTRGQVDLWAMLHTQLHRGHHVKVTQFQRFPVRFEYLHPAVSRVLFGPDHCAAALAPASCERHGPAHACNDDHGHDGPHQCACGTRWTERDDD